MDVVTMNKWTPSVCLALFSMMLIGHSQAGYEKHHLTVDETSGAVKVRLHEKWRSPDVGMEMEMPTIASTGANGNIKLSQQASVISVAANTTVEILEGSIPGLPMQRIVQDRGSAFYDIAPRGDNKLRVESAYLVAVVKGTQFNVSADTESTTIALFEGHLQIEAPSVGDMVDIFAGQIAKFHRGDMRISILDMNSGELITRSDSASGSGSGNNSDHSGGTGSGDTGSIPAGSGGGTGVGVTVAGTGETNTTVGIATEVGPAGVAVDGAVSLGLQNVDASLAGDVDLSGVGVASNLKASIDLANGAVGIGTDTSIDLGAASLDVGVNAGVDLNAGELDIGVDVGTAGVDAGVDLGVAGDAGTVDIGAGLDLGVVDTTGSVDVDAGLDLGLGGDVGTVDVDAGLDLGLGGDVGTVDVDAGLDLGLGGDVGTVDVDAGLDLGVVDSTGIVDVDVGLDLGLVDVDVAGDTLADDIGDLLDDLGAETDGADAGIEDAVPNLDDVPDLGGLLGL